MEVERKFLVKKIPENIEIYEKHYIEQGYLNFNPEVRIRRKDDLYFLTVKGDGTLSREEYETLISVETYLDFFQKVQGKLIKKDRYIIPINGGLNAELDIYHNFIEIGAMVEVEFENSREAYDFDHIIPQWFGKEVTYDEQFKNKNLDLILHS